MSKKLQIWLRPDQADCAMRALAYVSARFEGFAKKNDQAPAVVLACELAEGRAKEVHDIFAAALGAAEALEQ